jgi:hypothetical protein
MENESTSATTVAEGNVNFGGLLEAVPDESRLLTLLDEISDEDVPRLLHKRYRPTYLNLFALLRQQATATRIQELAVQLTKSSVWSVAAAERYVSRYPQNRLRLCLSGWQQESIHSLLTLGKGLIVCSFRFGMYSLVPVDVAAMGFPVSIPLAEVSQRATKALQGLRDRVNARTWLDGEEQRKLLNIASIKLLDVEAKHTSIALVKALRKGQVVVIYADGNNGADGPWGEEARIPVKFFGSSVFVKAGVARLAWSLGTPVLPVVSLRTGPDAGVLRPADPIIPPESGDHASKEEFLETSMQHLYKILESYAREYPEQWEGVSALHRWRNHTSDVPSSTSASAQQNVLEVASALRDGRRLRINEPGGITTFPGEEGVWIDTETMKCFRLPSWAQDLFRALTGERGVDQSWIDGQAEKERLLCLLVQLHGRRLIAAA